MIKRYPLYYNLYPPVRQKIQIQKKDYTQTWRLEPSPQSWQSIEYCRHITHVSDRRPPLSFQPQPFSSTFFPTSPTDIQRYQLLSKLWNNIRKGFQDLSSAWTFTHSHKDCVVTSYCSQHTISLRVVYIIRKCTGIARSCLHNSKLSRDIYRDIATPL